MRPGREESALQGLNDLAKAYDFMNYDVALLAQSEADALKHANVRVDGKRKTAKDTPFSMVTLKNGDLIGVVRFPSLKKGEDIPSDDQIKKLSTAIKAERKKVKLLLGLSDWGWVGEREYLAKNPDAVPDLLLGSGRGSGVNGRIEANGRCIWIRPYDKGRTVSEVQVYAWPDRSKPFAWKEPDNIKSLSIGLGDNYQDNPDVGALFQ